MISRIVSQCGNSRIFSHSDYVKSIFGESRSSNTVGFFWNFRGSEFVNLVDFNLQKVQKFTENLNSEPLNVLKWVLVNDANPSTL